MTTTRALRAEKRTAATALGGSVLTNKVRFTQLQTSEQMTTPVLRELLYTKNRLQHQVENLQDLSVTQAAKIQELTDEVEQYKTSLCEVQREARESIANLKNVIQGLTRTNQKLEDACSEMDKRNDELVKQNNLLSKSFEDILNEQKKLLKAIDTAGSVLANASMAQSIVMM